MDLDRQPPLPLPVSGDIPAGSGPQPPLAPGTAARIMTGARIPDGADTIVQVEFTDAGTDQVRIERVVPVGTGVRPIGDDMTPGEQLVDAGQSVTAGTVGMLAAAGIAELAVHVRPRVTVLATGAELVAAGGDLGWSGIHDSNAVTRATALREYADVTDLVCRSDDPGTFADSLAEQLAVSDLVITTGGVSAGAFEVVKEHLGRAPGFWFGKVAMQPGKPQGFGRRVRGPGALFPREPGERVRVGRAVRDPGAAPAEWSGPCRAAHHIGRSDEAVVQRPDVEQFRRGRYDSERHMVKLVGGRGSHLLAALARSNCLVRIPPGDGDLAAGHPVAVIRPIP